VQRSVTQLEGARTNLQTILDNLTAGVIVFDRDGHIDTVNPGATRILRLPLSAYRGRPLSDVPGWKTSRGVWQRFDLHRRSPEAGERDHWQDSFELQTGANGRDVLTAAGARRVHAACAADGVRRHHRGGLGAALGRLERGRAPPGARDQEPADAHPAVGRALQHKLEAKLEGLDQAMLVRSVGTIVNQVQAMKTLVNEFRDYARLPPPT
jgi:PAS domain-containing protein